MKKLIILSTVLVLVLSLFVTFSTAATEKVINVSAIAQVYAEGMEMVADQLYNELGVKLNYDMTPPQDAYSKYMIEFASQTSSFDLILFEPAWLADLSRHLEPIGPLMEKNKVDLLLDDIMPTYRNVYCSWEGKLLAIPWDGDQFNLFYNTVAFGREENKKAFKEKYGYELNPPETWEQYLQMAEFFNGRDWAGNGKLGYGTVEAWQRGGYAYWWWMAKFAAYGGVYFDEDMNPLINTPAAREALGITVKVAKFVPPGTANFGYPETETAFIKGDAPMVIQWSSTGKAAMNPETSSIAPNVGVSMLPGVMMDGKLFRRPVLPTGWAFGIPKYSKNKDIAIKIIEILSRPENALKIALDPATAVDPWRISSFDSEKWFTYWPENEKFGKDFVKVQRETVATGLPDLQIPGTDEYLQSLDTQISFAISGQKSVEDALADAEKEWNAITDRIGREGQKAAWLKQYNSMKAVGITYIPWNK